jgi:hypothetical protein
MAVCPRIYAAWLAADERERFLLRLRVLARILAHSWHCRNRALFMAGWMAGFLLSPLHALGPRWSVAIKRVDAIGLAVALLAALSLLLDPSDVSESDGRSDATLDANH